MPDLDFERITLNAIPDGDMPVFHASQYETMRPFIADLKWGSEDFAPGDGCWCTMAIRKTDDTLVIIDDIDIDTSTVSCILSQQSVACIGDNFSQLKVWATEGDEDKCIACLNFILHVQPDPEADGITSESEINNLTEQIEEITQQVIGDDYYTKVQTDALLDLKADKSTTYTKSEVDSALNLKADKSTTYTKSQVDSALALKADAATTYTKSQVDSALAAKADSADLATVATTGDYDDLINKPVIPAAQVQSDYAQADNTQVDYIKNKPDIDAMIAAALLAVMPVDSAGPSAIANFNTELAVDLVDCKTTLTPSLDGYTEVNITVADSEMTPVNTYVISLGDTYYGGTLDVTTGEGEITNDGVDLGSLTWHKNDHASYGTYFYADVSSLGIEKPEPNYTIPSTALCSQYTAAGRTVATFIDKTFCLDGTNTNVTQLQIKDSDYSDETTFQNAMSGVKFVYPLATPIVIDLGSGTAVTARAGVNNVYSDTGDTTVQFKDSIQHYIDTRS